MPRFSIRSWLNRISTSLRRRQRRTVRSIERLENRLVLSAYSVSSTLDSVDANPGDGVAADVDGNATLRAAVIDANALAGTDTITLGAGLFTMSLGGRNENAAATGDLDVSGNLIIEGAGADQTFLDAALLDRYFHVLPGSSLTLRNVTIRNGSEVSGGAIQNEGTLVLENVTLTANSTTIRGGAIYNNQGNVTLQSVNVSGNQTRDVGPTGGNSSGGALQSDGGTVTIQASQFANNSAAAQGGAISATSTNLTVSNTAFSQNSATVGGAVRLFNGTASFTNDTFNGDHGAISGGAIASNYCTLTITGGSFTGNYLTALSDFGELRNGGALYLVGINSSSTTATITGVTFQQGGSGDGGGIYNSNNRINLSNSTFDHMSGERGGSIWNTSGGLIVLWNTTFVGGSGTIGGAILNSAQMQMTNCTVTNTTSTGSVTVPSAAVANTGSFQSANNLIAGNVGGLDVSGAFSGPGGNLIGKRGTATGFTDASDHVGTSA
ncbi:MAG: polymorphic outer membrane protein, partial [Planctomycetaceae bacterium]|nr:polymorphic outer membrane protein [Planctomycetaceae bacterium]